MNSEESKAVEVLPQLESKPESVARKTTHGIPKSPKALANIAKAQAMRDSLSKGHLDKPKIQKPPIQHSLQDVFDEINELNREAGQKLYFYERRQDQYSSKPAKTLPQFPKP